MRPTKFAIILLSVEIRNNANVHEYNAKCYVEKKVSAQRRCIVSSLLKLIKESHVIVGILTIQRGTLRPRVSSPTRIEHPNLPPLNLHPHKRASRKGSGAQHTSDTLLRSSITSSTYIPTI